MTGRPPTSDDRELDRWIQEITDGWRQPRLRAGQSSWQDRVAQRSRRGWLERARRPVSLDRALAGVAGVAMMGVVALAVVLSSLPRSSDAPPVGGTPIAGSPAPSVASLEPSPSAPAPTVSPTAAPTITPGPTPSPTGAPPSNDVAQDDRFQLSITAGSTRYAANEPISISATLGYVGAEPETQIAGSGSGIVTFRIEDLDGPIDMGGSSTDDCAPYVFHSGEVQQKPFIKSGGYSPDDPDGPFWAAFFADPQLRLPPGRYRISALLAYAAPECGKGHALEVSVLLVVD